MNGGMNDDADRDGPPELRRPRGTHVPQDPGGLRHGPCGFCRLRPARFLVCFLEPDCP